MCGRFVVDVKEPDWAELREQLGLAGADAPRARFNLAPTQDMPGVVARLPSAKHQRGHADTAQCQALQFGISLGTSRQVINARSETLGEKPMFRPLLERGRALVIATAFYEWAPSAAPNQRKQPMCFALPSSKPFLFAALRELRPASVPGAVLVTTRANDTVAPSHGRMPVMLTVAQARRWLDMKVEVGEALALLQPYAGEMCTWPVGLQVNNPRYDAPTCAEALA